MVPWLWNWSPIIKMPLSGAVEQEISPETQWFFKGIPTKAGNAEIERKTFLKASYGKQIDILMDAVLHLADENYLPEEKRARVFDQLKELHKDINEVKKKHYEDEKQDLVERLMALQEKQPEMFKEVSSVFSFNPTSKAASESLERL